MIKRISIALAFFALVFASPAAAADKVKISFVVPVTEYADLLLGYDAGYFADEGLDVELVQAGGGVATPALIAATSTSPARRVRRSARSSKARSSRCYSSPTTARPICSGRR